MRRPVSRVSCMLHIHTVIPICIIIPSLLEPRKEHTARNLPVAAWKLPDRRSQAAACLLEGASVYVACPLSAELAGHSIVPHMAEDNFWDTARAPAQSIRLTAGDTEALAHARCYRQVENSH